jgi:phosphopantothenate-cysteine ligase
MNVLVTGGGTTAPIDDVRTITNISTGRFAAAISESCLDRGARVWHVHAPSAQLPLARLARFEFETADPAAEVERLRRLHQHWLSVRDRLHLIPLQTGTVADYARTVQHLLQSHAIDIAFLAMAVSDYEPVPYVGKTHSREGELMIRCLRTPKVIRSVRDWAPGVYLVGFKLVSRLTTNALILRAEASGQINRADLTVANDLQSLLAGQHSVHLVRPGQVPEALEPGEDLADRLVARVWQWAAGNKQ